jgi:hypothetical protein
MKKSIRKPENWQDFETLCKKLWGEIWQISSKIKKNGRLGQSQSGVDIYGIPKGETNYWGIQCKGKDDYTNAKLTKSEIDTEIEKAKKFTPKLQVFTFATTANKDVELEEYIRIKDLEYKSEHFEVLLYCWEDITDLIEENRETFNWYINEIGFREKYDLELFFNDFQKELTINPKFKKWITRHKLCSKQQYTDILSFFDNSSPLYAPINIPTLNSFNTNTVNRSWCKFKIVFENSGNKVIEDWKLTFEFKTGVREIYDPYKSFLTTVSNGLSYDYRTTYIYNEDKTIKYLPYKNAPLIQKDNKYFEVSILPEYNCDVVIIKWKLLARDFNKNGEMRIRIEPLFTEKVRFIDVYDESELVEDEVEFMDLIEEKKPNPS